MTPHNIRLLGALHHLVPQKRAEEIIQQIEARNGYYAHGKRLEDIDWRVMDAKTIGQEVYDDFCRIKGIAQVYKSQNVCAVLDLIARKLGYAEANDMCAQDYRTHERLSGDLNTYVWRKDYITRQEIDVPFVANAYWKKVIEPSLTDADRKTIQQRRAAAAPAVRREYADMELAKLIMTHLKKHRMRDFTYNHIADALNADWKQTSRLAHGMARRDPRVITFVRKEGHGKAVKLFKYAPERKLIDADVTRTEAIVSHAILQFLGGVPGMSVRAIKEMARDFFGYIADKTIDHSLAALVTAHKIVCKNGPHRSKLHFVSDLNSSDAE